MAHTLLGRPKACNLGPQPRVIFFWAEAYWILLRFAASLGVFLIQTLGAHVQQLKEMGPINYGTVLLLMRNLSINPSSPDFEPTVFWALELLLKLFSLWWRKYY